MAAQPQTTVQALGSLLAYSGHRDRLFRSIVITDSGDRDHSSERSDGVVLF